MDKGKRTLEEIYEEGRQYGFTAERLSHILHNPHKHSGQVKEQAWEEGFLASYRPTNGRFPEENVH